MMGLTVAGDERCADRADQQVHTEHRGGAGEH
jgi:hypothetical protein